MTSLPPKPDNLPTKADVESLADELERLRAAGDRLEQTMSAGSIDIEALWRLAREIVRADELAKSQIDTLGGAIAELEKIKF